MKWICKTCWRHGDVQSESFANYAHHQLIREEEARTPIPGSTRGHFKFEAARHEPDFLFGEAAIRTGRIKRDPGQSLDLEAGEPLELA